VDEGEKVTFVLSLYDRDNDNLKIELISEPKKGRLRQTSLSAFRYSPLQNAIGKDSFAYRVYDGISYSKEAYRVDIKIIEEKVVVQQQPIMTDSDGNNKDGGNNMLLIVGGLLLLLVFAGDGGGGSGDGGGSGTGIVDIGITGP